MKRNTQRSDVPCDAKHPPRANSKPPAIQSTVAYIPWIELIGQK